MSDQPTVDFALTPIEPVRVELSHPAYNGEIRDAMGRMILAKSITFHVKHPHKVFLVYLADEKGKIKSGWFDYEPLEAR